MIKQWLFWINLAIGGLITLLVLATLLTASLRPSEIEVVDIVSAKRPLPQGSFALPKNAYECIGKNMCELKFATMTLQLPDLRNQLVYYGKNGRPDAQAERPILHFAFSNNTTPMSIPAGERLYLIYDRKKTPGQYVGSPGNAETSLWIEATSHGNEATILVSIRDENGTIIREPSAHAQFTLQEKEALRTSGRSWEIGKWRVDGSLLARQKARWMGQDLFLERHGGEEFRSLLGKHRLDFTDEETNYSVYVGVQDCLIWKDDRWQNAQIGKESTNYPLLLVKKIDDRLMNLEMWDVDGKGRIPLTLIRGNEASMGTNLQEQFNFLGARTRSQYIFEVDGQRVLLSPKDWLLQTEEDGWIKLTTPQEVDDYVERKLTGVLFVFDGVVRKEGRQVLMGVVFNAARTEMQEVELPVQQGGVPTATSVRDDKYSSEVASSSVDDDDDDDDDEIDEG